jgi:hypothetical protein
MKSEGFVSYTPRTWHPDTRSPSPRAKDEGFVQHRHAPPDSSEYKVRGLLQSQHAGTCSQPPPRWPGFPPRAVTLPALHPPPPRTRTHSQTCSTAGAASRLPPSPVQAPCTRGAAHACTCFQSPQPYSTLHHAAPDPVLPAPPLPAALLPART